ncbi:Sodium-dependent dicarboxylate transporter SdcS [Pelotomaculum schinkii]|uniref:Sodium-dependent dicarboxylate transporter SdcS n=1 Tax=Pelotomaculum schinkii TaxID=78350 RepID=A0A4Y7R7C3_9FIRM|nr:DASS family sodium-coupled anion symporter [Pelotomaculum schinkii]TEB04520.1 Sodium-dependent dicarboxylate transporter SdcS [Pelotomaculum schinkii]
MQSETKASTVGIVTRKRAIWLIAIVVIYFVLINLPTPNGLSLVGQKALALMLIVVITWVTGIIPIGIASLLFVFLQSVIGIADVGTAVGNFANPTLLFVLSSFFLAIALDVSGLNNRISLKLTVLSGGSPKKALFYLMAATAVLSMVISDVPACAAFYSIGLALLRKNNCKVGSSNLGKAMMIGIPVASLIGGAATPAGSSLNVLALSLMKSTANIDITFLQWAAIGIPIVIIALPLTWKIMTFVFPPELERLIGIEDIQKDYQALGHISAKEIKFIVIFALLLITWFTESIHKIPLPASATFGAVLFFLPGIDLLSWENTKHRIGWDIILLIGAASSLGTAFWKSGAATWMANGALSWTQGVSLVVVVLVVVIFTTLIHLLLPVNPAIISIMVPALVGYAATIGMGSPLALVIPMAQAVHSAFLLPLDSVPLITYASGYYTMVDFFKSGWIISILWCIVITAVIMVIAPAIGLF